MSTTYTTSSGQGRAGKTVPNKKGRLSGQQKLSQVTHSPLLILNTSTVLGFPSSIFLSYAGDRGQVPLSRKEAIAKRTLLQEKALVRHQHVLFRSDAPHRVDQKLHPKRVSDGNKSIEAGIVMLTMKLCRGTRGDDCKTRTTHCDSFWKTINSDCEWGGFWSVVVSE